MKASSLKKTIQRMKKRRETAIHPLVIPSSSRSPSYVPSRFRVPSYTSHSHDTPLFLIPRHQPEDARPNFSLEVLAGSLMGKRHLFEQSRNSKGFGQGFYFRISFSFVTISFVLPYLSSFSSSENIIRDFSRFIILIKQDNPNCNIMMLVLLSVRVSSFLSSP